MVIFAAVMALSQQQPKILLPASSSGTEVIQKMRSAVRAASPLEGRLESTRPTGQKAVMDFKAMYPKLFSGSMKMFGLETLIVWNLEGLHMFMPANKSYQVVKRDSLDLGLVGIESMFGDEDYFSQVGECREDKFEDKAVLAVPLLRMAGKTGRKVVLYVDPKSFLPVGYDEENPEAGGTNRSVYRKLAHAKLTSKDFEFRKPGVE